MFIANGTASAATITTPPRNGLNALGRMWCLSAGPRPCCSTRPPTVIAPRLQQRDQIDALVQIRAEVGDAIAVADDEPIGAHAAGEQITADVGDVGLRGLFHGIV